MRRNNGKLSIVVSAYNEEAALPKFYEAASKQLSEMNRDYEIIFVNDGSKDKTQQIIKEYADSDRHVKGINFSRNFGHEAAMIAGIDYAGGDYIICMDADLQHPVKYIPQILEKLQEGTDVVCMMRLSNESAGKFKNKMSDSFYKLMNRISDADIKQSASDFFGISARVAEVLRNDYREKVRFIRGYIQNVGFKKAVITYDADERVAGKSKYNMCKLTGYALNTITGYTVMPLRLGLYIGAGTGVAAVIAMILTIIFWIVNKSLNGFAALAVLILFIAAVLFILIGILGTYLAVIFEETKNRPIYIVDDLYNIN